jgi:uncharacterized protein
MIIGLYEISLRLPGIHSLKEKRSVLKPLSSRIRQRFNVSLAEVGGQDKWQLAELAVACVAVDSVHAHRLLEQVLEFIERDGNVQVISSNMQLM